MRPHLRSWQVAALESWRAAGHRGIAQVVTGGGKTVFALECARVLRSDTTLVVVPTVALLDQWWEEAASYFDLALEEVHILTGRGRLRPGTLNIGVLNTVAKLHEAGETRPCFLIVDECHKAATPRFQAALDLPTVATLGLSATPERQYDDGFTSILVPRLGQVLVRYSYADALRDGVIVPFRLRNVVFELEEERQAEYDALTRRIARSIQQHGDDAPETVALFLKRARVLNLSLQRVRLALKIVAAHRGQRVLVFHEDIEACNLIHQILAENGVPSGVYHSKLTLRDRAETLQRYRTGAIQVLVTCRALDEGFNVPETQVGVIAASTATVRQRIQRLGRVLRPADGKAGALIYTLAASSPEMARLRQEEASLEGVADVSWSRG